MPQTTPYDLCSGLSAGFIIPTCTFGAGGISDVWITNSTGLTVTFDSDNQITNISGATFYHFQQIAETASVNEVCHTNKQNTSQYWEAQIEFVIPKKSVAIRNQVKSITSQGSRVILKDSNGMYKYYGFNARAYDNSSENKSGKALGDQSAYIIKLQTTESQESFFVSSESVFTSSY